jgi:cephalosporin-C deacetylase-like acetyl esterase
VQYYFRLCFEDIVHTLSVISVFSQPDASLLAESSHTVYACHYQGDNSLTTIDVKQIKAVVAMIPYFRVINDGIQVPETEHFLVEKPYLDVTYFRGEEDPDSETEGQEEREEHGQD